MSEEPFVPIDKLAQHFSVSVSTVRTWVRQGRIPRDTYIKAGNTYRFSIPAVTEAMLNTDKSENSPVNQTEEPDDTDYVDLDLGPDEDF